MTTMQVFTYTPKICIAITMTAKIVTKACYDCDNYYV